MSPLPTVAAVLLVATPLAAQQAPAPEPAASGIIAVDGRDVYHEVHGDLGAATTPVLVLHGGMMTIPLAFADLIPELAGERAVIGVEQQGHGRTPDHEGPMTLATMRADTLGVLDALGVKRAHVVGFSMGGMLGLELAVNAPERVASLTAISASQNNEGMLPDLVRMNREAGYQPPPEIAALLPTEAQFAAMARGFADNPSGPDIFGNTMQEAGALIASDWGWSDEQLAAIAAPALVLIGDRDFILPEHALHMAQTIPDAWLGVLPDTTHMNILMHPALPGLITQRIRAAEAEAE